MIQSIHHHLSVNVNGRLLDLSSPLVMGILNATPDSFYAASRVSTEDAIASRADEIIEQGGVIIDIGAYSTRPGCSEVSEDEEMARMRHALSVVRKGHPDAIISVDTFRASVARMAVEEYGAAIINDVSEGEDPAMFETVAELGAVYILTSQKPNLTEMLKAFAAEVNLLHALGVKDIILDPGFGFGKTLEDNYALFSELEKLQVMNMPILVGISRKSMISRLLDGTPGSSLNGTTALDTVALMKGATLLRVHDVREAVEVCKIVDMLQKQNK